MVLTILLDTNFILLPLTLGKNLYSQLKQLINLKFKIVVLKESLLELEKLKKKHKIFQTNMDIIKKIWPGLEILESEGTGTVDDLILQTASSKRLVVATNDMELKKKLKKHSIPVIFLRQKSRLEVETRIPLEEYYPKN
ncbi:MAG: hypothetical protein ACTSYQ_00735 [Candidatus Odinarchaeia archaeon]